MPSLTTGPILVPNKTSSGNPINHVFISLTNLSRTALTVYVEIHQALLVSDPNGSNFPSSEMTALLPSVPITLAPSSAVMFSQKIEQSTPPTEADSTDDSTKDAATQSNPQILVVTISGDVTKPGDLIQVSVTGGFSSDGFSLEDAVPMISFRHADLEHVHPFGNSRPPRRYY